MNINRIANVPVIDLDTVIRAQKRLYDLHAQLGSWWAVGSKLNLDDNLHAKDFALRGIVPTDKGVRVKLGLPRVMPSERVVKKVEVEDEAFGIGCTKCNHKMTTKEK